MTKTRMERECRANQYGDSPLVAAIGLLGIFLRLFSRRLLVRWVIRLVGLRGGFDTNPGVVGQSIGTGCDYAITFREAIQNLHLIALPDSCLHCFLVGAIVGASIFGSNDHHIAGSVR